MKPPKACAQSGCGALTHVRYCERHKREVRRRQDKWRGSAASRGYDRQWRKARAAYLNAHPLCAECERADRVTSATVVDHITPHKGNHDLFRDRDNWQPLCKRCHDIKTATEDGGFGAFPRSPG